MLAGTVTAANVSISIVADGNDNGWAAVNYTADANVRSFALKIEVASASVGDPCVVDINNYHEGESTTSSKGYGIFLGENGVDINDAGVVQGWGSPVADACEPGASGTGLGTKAIIIGLGALYEDGNQPPLSGKLCDIQVGPAPTICKVSATAEPIRVAVVLEDTNSVTPNVTGATDVKVRNCNTWNTSCARADICGTDWGNPDDVITMHDFLWLVNYYPQVCGTNASCNRADICGTDWGAKDGKITMHDFLWLVNYYPQSACQ
jgi:hypothetical protein